MSRVHEQCKKIDSGTVLSQTRSKQAECTKCRACWPAARPSAHRPRMATRVRPCHGWVWSGPPAVSQPPPPPPPPPPRLCVSLSRAPAGLTLRLRVVRALRARLCRVVAWLAVSRHSPATYCPCCHNTIYCIVILSLPTCTSKL